MRNTVSAMDPAPGPQSGGTMKSSLLPTGCCSTSTGPEPDHGPTSVMALTARSRSDRKARATYSCSLCNGVFNANNRPLCSCQQSTTYEECV